MSLPDYVRKGTVEAAQGIFNNVRTEDDLTVGGFVVGTVATGLTAHAGGTKAAALALTASVNRVTVCATANDSVLLPEALAGRQVAVFNDGAASMRVFGQGTDTIDGAATGTGVPLANAKRALFICVADGVWISAQLGVVSA